MSIFSGLAGAAIAAVLMTGSAVRAQDSRAGPHLGMPATEADIRAWDRGITPDGRGLPRGNGSARIGAELYREKCESCHGERGSGGSAEELAGSDRKLTDDPPDKTIGTYWPYATTVFDFVRRTMPLYAPGSLSADDAYALTAYLLYLNHIVSIDARLDAAALAAIRMPNRQGFDWVDVSKPRDLKDAHRH